MRDELTKELVEEITLEVVELISSRYKMSLNELVIFLQEMANFLEFLGKVQEFRQSSSQDEGPNTTH